MKKTRVLGTACLAAMAVIVLMFIPLYSFAGGAQEKGTATTKEQPVVQGADSSQKEAPMLAELVKAGELPPVEERIPADPEVIEPFDSLGEYGGVAHVLHPHTNGYADAVYLCGIEGPLRLARDNVTIAPNVVKEWEFSDDYTSITLFLREGMKWSDGDSFDADDMMFYYEDIYMHDEISPNKRLAWTPGGNLMRMTKVDDYTVRMSWPQPYPLVVEHLAHWTGVYMMLRPKHYLQQFHPRYTDEEKLTKMAKDRGFETWLQLWGEETSGGMIGPRNTDIPTLRAFKLEEHDSDGARLVRNPYYWKVDTAGRQLPYMDRIVVRRLNGKEMYDAQIVTGQADFAGNYTTMDNFTLYKEAGEKNDYQVYLWKSAYGADVFYQPNQTIDRPNLRQAFRDVRFRKALSYAINRDEINEVIYFGLAKPRQLTVLENSKYYDPKYEMAWAEYDADKANALLDEMGLQWDSNREYRVFADGERVAWTLEYYPGQTPKTPVSELVVGYWKDVGLDVTPKEISSEVANERIPGNQVEMMLHHCSTSDIMFTQFPAWQWGVWLNWDSGWGPEWARYYVTDGEAGEEPPPTVKRLHDLFDKFGQVPEDERIRIGKEVMEINYENLWCIGTVGQAPVALIVRDNLKNVPREGMWGWDFLWTNTQDPEQFYLAQPLHPHQKQ